MKYDRALADFRRFLLSHNLSADTLTGGDIYDYAVESLWRGQSPATVIQRLNILNSIFRRRPASAQAPVPGPREMARLIGEPSFELPPLLKTAVYERCLTMLRTIASDGNATTSGADFLLYAVLNPGIHPEKLILLTKSDIGESKGLSRQILRRNAASQIHLRPAAVLPHTASDSRRPHRKPPWRLRPPGDGRRHQPEPPCRLAPGSHGHALRRHSLPD